MVDRRGQAWNDEDVAKLRSMADAGSTLPIIARSLGRTQEAVHQRAVRLRIAVQSVAKREPGGSRYLFVMMPGGKPQITVWSTSEKEAERLARAELKARANFAGRELPAGWRLDLRAVTSD